MSSMADRNPMSRKGFEKLKADLEHLETVEMPRITEKVAAAREEGDLKENAEYHGARESQGMIQAKINAIKSKLSRAYIIDPASIDQTTVGFFATITVEDLDLDEEETYTLVGNGEEDFMNNKILIDSPMAQSLLGHKVGDVVEIQAPKGAYELKILKIEYNFD
ncbi:transcription elongation factor GreA [Blastopirellula sp. JC732]|uniref:Transcription elongation factor GreA n=2 Tax=Blastopirellula sediminis TaxID=2894196 RepID=A0A9X1SEQ0_9BACT|nr:transcription elongation factor GreA [Blastopirellula sediminis]MCC9627012.1 transcription elongation factor GreA [Blastopirellula sediminis]